MTNPNPTLHASTLQRASLFQLPSISQVCASGFMNDGLFGATIHPHRHQFPDDMHRWFLKRFMVDYWDPRHYFMITTTTVDASTGQPEPTEEGTTKKKTYRPTTVVTGLAHWARETDSWRPLWHYPFIYLIQPIAKLYSHIYAFFFPNRAASPENEGILERATAVGPYLGGARSEHWMLHLMVVHPDYQAHGLGKKLVTWGLEKAKADGVSAAVISAAGKEGFYEKCGYDQKVVRIGDIVPEDGSRNEMAELGLAGGWLFFKDFEGKGGKVIEEV